MVYRKPIQIAVSMKNRTRIVGGIVALAIAVALPLLSLGCSVLRKNAPSADAIGVDDQTPSPATPASIQISYAKPNDTLKTVVVSTFTGANVLRTQTGPNGEESLVRFDGGVPVWRFHAERKLNPLSKTSDHVASVSYGKVPPGFSQDIPEVGPPPPLDAGGYYIFAIERASGAVSYQALRVESDLTLQSYDAEPRAGTSYRLCCDVNSDFAEPTPDNGIPDSLPTTPPDQQP